MLKKIFPLFLWFFVSVFSLSILYVIGVLRNWTDTTTVLYWIFVILYEFMKITCGLYT